MIAPVFVNSSFVAAPERFVLSGGRWAMARLRVRYGFLDHPKFGPVLIDTGYTSRVTEGNRRSLSLKLYAGLIRPDFCADGDVLVFLQSRGLKPVDVRTVIVTHFHADHVSALCDFPKARFFAPRAGWDALRRNGALANIRHGIFTELLPADIAERVRFFDEYPLVSLPGGGQGHDLFGDGSIVSMDFPGHAPGHSGLWFGAMDRPCIYATDVQWMRRAVLENRVPGFPATRVATNQNAADTSTRRLQALAGTYDFLLCHQPELHRLDLVKEQS